jgi:hypothetical protein
MLLLLSLARENAARAAESVPSPSAGPRAAIAVWDTVKASAEPLAPPALAEKPGWVQVALQQKVALFQGDAVLSNGRILAVLRQRGRAVELYTAGDGSPVARLQLHLLTLGGEPADRVRHVDLVENNKGAACVEASFQTTKGAAVTAKFRLKRGDVFVQVEPGPGAGRLRVECPARFVVLPDFFADDIVLDARNTPPGTAELPSDNFLLHLAGKGDGIALCVFENRKQDVTVALAGAGGQRTVTASEIGFEGKKVWAAVLEGPQVWHAVDVKAGDAGKVLPLDWKMPFPAQWRVDFTRPEGLTDSWEMLLPAEKGKGYVKPAWLGAGAENLNANRRRWNTVLGTYPYPCWSDDEGRGYLQPLQNRALRFQGPVVAYPINRVKETPLDAYTVVDVMRATLGVGPCEYLLDLEGQKSAYKGRATCSVRDELGAIYRNGQQKQERARVEKILDEGLAFVTHIRGRITRYVDFGHKLRHYLAAQRQAHPELAEFLTEVDGIVREIDGRVAARADKIQTPAHVAAMNAAFRKDVLDAQGPDALAKCREYTTALVVIGDNQDELSGECRWVVKRLRQRAGILMALDPRAAPVAVEVRARAQEVLRNPASHEGAHH